MFKIALTAGHYKHTPGKRCLKSLDPKETREWVLNDRIADKVEKRLKESYTGYELLRMDDTTGEKEILLAQRTGAANKWGADFYLSIHHNAGIKGGSGGGIVAYTYTKACAASNQWRDALYDALIKYTGLKGNRSTPRATADLHECRETDMPAVLLELGFMDSSKDVPIILTEDYADACATAIVEVLANMGGLTKKAITSSDKPTCKSTAKPTSKPATTTKSKKSTKVEAWQKAAVKDGFEFPEAGVDGIWGSECEAVAKKALVKKRTTYKYENLTKIVQKAVGLTGDDVDGLCGAQTDSAIRNWQKSKGLTVDGIVGLNSWKKILEVK